MASNEVVIVNYHAAVIIRNFIEHRSDVIILLLFIIFIINIKIEFGTLKVFFVFLVKN